MKFSNAEIEKEIQDFSEKPVAYSGRSYPFSALSDRQFEILLYSIFKKEIESGKHEGQYDDISLMVGVGDRGRDSTLHHRGANVGLIQCKKEQGRVTKPNVAREVIKFVLHYLKDNTLITDPSNFTYYFAVSNDFTEPATELLRNFNEHIVEDKDFEAWTNQVIQQNKTLHDLQVNNVKDPLSAILRSISVKKLTSSDLNIKLRENDSLVPLFFEVKLVVRYDEVKKLEDSMHDRFDRVEAKISGTTNGGTIKFDAHSSRVADILSLIDTSSSPVPFEHFVGRARVLEELIETAKKTPILVILGIPGVGKSVLLNHLALEYAPKDAVFQYNFPAELASLNDVLLRLAIFLDRKSQQKTLTFAAQSLLSSGQIQTAIDLILKNLNASKNYLFFDSLHYIEKDGAILGFFELLKANLRQGNVFVAGRTKPGFFTMRAFGN